MQMTSLPFWLMIASIAIAVLPVWRSPMISSRWPRPIGIIASMALIPVCTAVSRSGGRSRRERCARSASLSVAIGPLPSIGWPSALTTRPIRASPTGTSRCGRSTGLVALLDVGVVAQNDHTDRVFQEVEGHPQNPGSKTRPTMGKQQIVNSTVLLRHDSNAALADRACAGRTRRCAPLQRHAQRHNLRGNRATEQADDMASAGDDPHARPRWGFVQASPPTSGPERCSAPGKRSIPRRGR